MAPRLRSPTKPSSDLAWDSTSVFSASESGGGGNRKWVQSFGLIIGLMEVDKRVLTMHFGNYTVRRIGQSPKGVYTDEAVLAVPVEGVSHLVSPRWFRQLGLPLQFLLGRSNQRGVLLVTAEFHTGERGEIPPNLRFPPPPPLLNFRQDYHQLQILIQ